MSNKKTKSQEELLSDALVPVEEQPYGVPKNWSVVRLKSVCLYIQRGKSPKYADDIREIPVISQKCVQWSGFDISRARFIDPFTITNYQEERLLRDNDILWNSTGQGTIGRVALYRQETNEFNIAVADSHVTIVRANPEIINPVYLYYWLASPVVQQDFLGNLISGSTNQTELSTSRVKDLICLLPPLNEQKRIVDKVERLLDKINQAKQLIEEAKATFELRRAAILDKAFRGELTKKWRTDNQDKLINGTELYELIKSDRFENVESNRELKELVQLFESFSLQESINANGWVHLKANMFCININCGRTPSNDLSDSGEVPFLKVYNIVNNKIDFEYKPQFIPKEVSDSALGKSKLLPNDVIMNIVGPPLKKIAIIPEDYPEWSMNQAIVRFRPLKYVLPKYLFYCLQFDETLREVINETRGVVGQSNISVSQSRNLSMPIPSIDEQHEIVYMLEQLIQKESTVLDILNAKKDELELLTQSILAKAFTGSLGTGDAAEEPAINLSSSSN